MKELQEIYKYTKDLLDEEPEKSAYWHYNKLIKKIEEVIDVIQCCESDRELLTSFAEYLKERDILTTKKENIPVRVDLFLKRG